MGIFQSQHVHQCRQRSDLMHLLEQLCLRIPFFGDLLDLLIVFPYTLTERFYLGQHRFQGLL